MKNNNTFDKSQFFIKGGVVAENFRSLINGINSSRTEDIMEHWDIKIDVKFDVKSMSKETRNSDFNITFHWVELVGITGMPGWLYGKADYIAFERKNHFFCVDRIDLVKLVETKCTDKTIYRNPGYYQIKQREGNKDQIIKVPVKDLMTLKYFLIDK